MKKTYANEWGVAILILGIICLFASLVMKTTAGSEYLAIENIGLLNNRLVCAIISCFICLIGALMILFGIVINKIVDASNLNK